VSYGKGLLRLAGIALYVAAMLAPVAALGVFVSTLTEVPIAAMAATALTVVVVEVLDIVPQLEPLHPWLFTHDWLDFGDLLRDPVSFTGMAHGLVVQACWNAVLVTLSWARMTSRDVTSCPRAGSTAGRMQVPPSDARPDSSPPVGHEPCRRSASAERPMSSGRRAG